MTTPITHSYTAAGKQRGSTLIIALIMLLLISLLAVASMQDTILQERMTSNVEDRTIAFEGAEAALRAGEDWLVNSAGDSFMGNGALNPPTDWPNANPTAIPLVEPRAAGAPEYHLGPNRCPELVEQGCPVEMFHVTARGVGGRNTTEVFLRTSFGRLQ